LFTLALREYIAYILVVCCVYEKDVCSGGIMTQKRRNPVWCATRRSIPRFFVCPLSCAHISHISFFRCGVSFDARHCRVHLMQNNEELLCQRRRQHDRSLASVRHLLRFGKHLWLGAHAGQRRRRRRPGRERLQGPTHHAEVPVGATLHKK
jgi:hypothetical protein